MKVGKCVDFFRPKQYLKFGVCSFNGCRTVVNSIMKKCHFYLLDPTLGGLSSHHAGLHGEIFFSRQSDTHILICYEESLICFSSYVVQLLATFWCHSSKPTGLDHFHRAITENDERFSPISQTALLLKNVTVSKLYMSFMLTDEGGCKQ